jgi:hypothetical protein
MIRKVLGLLIVSCCVVVQSTGIAQVQAEDQLPTKVDSTCIKCHADYEKTPGLFAGKFADVSTKAQALQINVDNNMEVMYYDDNTVLKNAPSFREIPKGESLRVKYEKKDGKNLAKLVEVKKGIEVSKDKLATVEDIADLVAKGPEKGKYILLDSRPENLYNEGHMPTAVSMPFGAFDKLAEKLLKDKDALQIYYCSGFS